jgi:hypothetical protein
VGQMPGVRHADACWGLPDIFACVDTRDEKTLTLLMMDEFQRLGGVDRTGTHIVVEWGADRGKQACRRAMAHDRSKHKRMVFDG